MRKPTSPYHITDAGGHEASCATVNADIMTGITLRYWVLGFWSGLNTAIPRETGRHTDVVGVLGELKLYCDNHPSETVINAVEAVYDKLGREGK